MTNLRLGLQLVQSVKQITPREFQVAELATLSNPDIARVLGISRATVAAHLANVSLKTGLETRAAIAVWADRQSRERAA